MCRITRISFLLLYFSFATISLSTAQTPVQKIAGKTFKIQLLRAIENQQLESAAELIRSHRRQVGAVVDELLSGFLRKSVAKDSTSASDLMKPAEQIAQLYQQEFQKDIFMKKARLYRNWNLEQKGNKIYADSLKKESAKIFDQHKYEIALKLVQEARGIYENLADTEARGKCLNSIGLIDYRLNHFPEAERSLKESLKINREMDLIPGIIANLNNLATLYKARHQYQAALQAYLEGMKLSQKIGDADGLANQWSSLGTIYQAMEDHKNARAYYDRAIRYAERTRSHKLLASVLLNRGSLTSDQSHFRKALKYWQRGIKIARKFGFRSLEGSFLSNMSIAYRNLAQYDDALETLKQALELNKENRNVWDQGNNLREMGILFYYKGLPDSCLIYWNKSIETFQSIPDWSMVGMVTGHIGVLYKNTGRPYDALRAYEKALTLVREVDNQREEANILTNLGNVYSDILGDYPAAEKCFQDALKIKQKIGETRFIGVILGNLGVLCKKQGKYQSSLEYYRRALKIALQGANRSDAAKITGDIGAIYAELDELGKAIEYYQKNLAILDELGENSAKPEVLVNLGSAYLAMDQDSLALASFRRAESLAVAQDRRYVLMDIDTNFGKIYEEQGKSNLALQSYQKALRIAEETASAREKAGILRTIGNFYLSQTDDDRALSYYEQSLRIARKIESPEEIWRALAAIGNIQQKSGENDKAVQTFKESIEIIESLRAKMTVASLRESFMEKRLEVYKDLAFLLFELGRTEEAFEYLEKAKARTLLDILGTERIHITEGIDPELLREKKKTEFLLKRVNQLISSQSGQPEIAKGTISTLQDSLTILRSRYDQLLQEIKLSYPRYAQLTGMIEPLTLHDIQKKIIPKNTILIDYFVKEEKTLALMVRPDTLLGFKLDLSEQDIRSAVDTLLADFRAVGRGEIHNFTDIRFNLKTAHNLYRKLIAPMEIDIPEGSSLVIIPDGVLHYLPFETLVVNFDKESVPLPWYKRLFSLISKPQLPPFNEYERATYLVEKYAISYAPSASILDAKILHTRKSKQISDQLAIFASPDFSSASPEALTALETSGISNMASVMLLGANNTWTFLPLQQTAVQAREMAKRIKPAKLFIGQEATEKAFKKEAGKYRFIHIATHTVTEERMPLYSRIVFSQNKKSEDEDGFLHTYEIFNLRLNADLITLAGCRTGLGKLSRGEGLIGLTRAFMYAGVPSVVVSLWAVEESSGLLMNYFYENIKSGMGKSAALRQAKLRLMQSRGKLPDGMEISYAHPFLWAPFVLVGEYR